MASPEAVANRRANRAAARVAKLISKKLRDISLTQIEEGLLKSAQLRKMDKAYVRHVASWEKFHERRSGRPRFATLTSDRRHWEAMVALVDRRSPTKLAWFFDLSEKQRFTLCVMGRETRAANRRFKLAQLTVRQRFDAIQKGRKFELSQSNSCLL